MSANRKRSRLIRERMSQTGESYTAAARAVDDSFLGIALIDALPGETVEVRMPSDYQSDGVA